MTGSDYWGQVTLGLCIVATTLGWICTVVVLVMAHQINAKLPSKERIEVYWGGISRKELSAKYRHLYPDGRLHLVVLRLLVCSLLLQAAGIVTLILADRGRGAP